MASQGIFFILLFTHAIISIQSCLLAEHYASALYRTDESSSLRSTTSFTCFRNGPNWGKKISYNRVHAFILIIQDRNTMKETVATNFSWSIKIYLAEASQRTNRPALKRKRLVKSTASGVSMSTSSFVTESSRKNANTKARVHWCSFAGT